MKCGVKYASFNHASGTAMNIVNQQFIGIDLSNGRGSLTWAVLDRALAISALEQGDLDTLTKFLSGLDSVVAAVNAPSGTTSRNNSVAEKGRKAMRAAEVELRSRGLLVPRTPSKIRECPVWVKTGFELYRKLGQAGYQPYPEADPKFQFMETNALAGFAVLAGHAVLQKQTLEGRLQRQLLLFERGLRMADPMDFFEEVTRYKIMRGMWPMEVLYTPPQLDALCAAFTAWMVGNKPAQTMMIGDVREGRIVLPGHELKESY